MIQMSSLHNTSVCLVYLSNFMTDAFYTFRHRSMLHLHTPGP
jgi:hypothetical protein|nr:hypothetical protein [Polaromonas sp. 39-63-25]